MNTGAMTKPIKEITQEIKEELDFFGDDALEKQGYIVDMGKALPPLDERYKIDKYLIEGCQAKVWLVAELKNGLVNLRADSNAITPKGIISMLIEIFNNHTPEEILDTDPNFINTMGIKDYITGVRGNGLDMMIQQIRKYSAVFMLQLQDQNGRSN